MHVAVHLKPPVGTIGQIIVPVGVAADRVYRPPMLPWDVVSSYLAFPPLPTELLSVGKGGLPLPAGAAAAAG